MRSDFQNPIAEDMDEFGKVGAEMSYIQSQMHSVYDSAESIADSDLLEDGELRKMLASPLYMQDRGDCKSSRIPTASGKPAAMILERGASAKRTQADHSRRESLMSRSTQEARAYGKADAMFHQGAKNPETISRVLSSNTLIRQICEDLLLKAISELQQQAYTQRLELQDTEHGYVESRREQVRSQEELPLQKLKEIHETIQKLTSQLQEMQNQVNSVNDSGEFQEVETNYSGRWSYVSSQPAMIPSARSMLSRDKRLPLDTGNASGLQENVFGNQFSTFDSHRDHPQGIHSCATQRERGSVTLTTGTGTVFTRDDKK